MIDGEEGVVAVVGGGFGGGRVGHSRVAGKKVAAWFLAVLANSGGHELSTAVVSLINRLKYNFAK